MTQFVLRTACLYIALALGGRYCLTHAATGCLR
jgi:hypothetical protein